jgi:hypothetical protein
VAAARAKAERARARARAAEVMATAAEVMATAAEVMATEIATAAARARAAVARARAERARARARARATAAEVMATAAEVMARVAAVTGAVAEEVTAESTCRSKHHNWASSCSWCRFLRLDSSGWSCTGLLSLESTCNTDLPAQDRCSGHLHRYQPDKRPLSTRNRHP